VLEAVGHGAPLDLTDALVVAGGTFGVLDGRQAPRDPGAIVDVFAADVDGVAQAVDDRVGEAVEVV
jgi:hypothetical protein